MKQLLSVLLIVFLFGACKNNDGDTKDKDTKEKTSKKDNSDDETADEDKKKESSDDSEEGWTSSQKKKASKRYVELLETQNKKLYDNNSEEAVQELADCMIGKISTRMTYSEYGEIMDNVEADKNLKGLDTDLKKKAESVNPFFDKCRQEAGVKEGH